MAARPVVAFCDLEDWEAEYLRQGPLQEYQLILKAGHLTREEAQTLGGVDAASVFIYSQVTREVLDAVPSLRMVATRSTGFNHVDVGACVERGVALTNVPRYGENTVAEHAFALILALSRKVHQAYQRTSRYDFSLSGLRGFDLKGKTLGVVGAGSIGLHVIRIAKGFGMEVLAYDTREQAILAEVLGFTYVPLSELLQRSDVVTLHVPLTESTRHMINREAISMMKDGAILINTARGELVDTAALVWGLDTGKLGGAGLDVLEGEETIREEAELLSESLPYDRVRAVLQGYALLRRENVVLTPHMAFYSQEAQHRILDTTVQNILSFFSGTPMNRVV
ncbi:MAG: hydroxyacid dehydrogenase [Armatimonadota bacterium]